MKPIVFLTAFLLSVFFVKAQKIDSLSMDSLHDFEIRLSGLSYNMVRNFDEEVRITSGRNFIRQMGRALKVKNSYYYPFDSLKNLMILYSPDGLFRIFTWNVATNDEKFRYFGVIQMNPDKLKKLNKKQQLYENFYPLIDRSDSLESFLIRETDANHWFGAAYYKIIKTTFNKVDYYTLLGWDGAGPETNRKVADVLYFRSGIPVFGAPIFDLKRKTKYHRMVFEFNNQATIGLRYDEKRKILIYENIVPDKPANAGFVEHYYPDGSFDYLLWKNGNWEKQKGFLEN
ncbi:MAG: hypothetical protein CFE21_14145 [Bacteroidetes bacterium B1(2017)]|nr:MAG: hypothetical protein CFE21_14145 [Bacteroidetes bacterium B1(2017)]